MTVFAGFDVHRAQITFDALDTETGEVTRGSRDPRRRPRSSSTRGVSQFLSGLYL